MFNISITGFALQLISFQCLSSLFENRTFSLLFGKEINNKGNEINKLFPNREVKQRKTKTINCMRNRDQNTFLYLNRKA